MDEEIYNIIKGYIFYVHFCKIKNMFYIKIFIKL